MKNDLWKSCSVIVNLIEGACMVLAIAISYAFIFEAQNKNHDIGLGFFILLVWLLVLLLPNLFFMFIGKFRIKETLFYQLLPLISGAVFFTVYQLILH